MKKLIKPYSFLFYFLVILVFFFLGIIYAGLVDAGKNQGLAGGAIVLGYGVIAAFFAFLVSLFAVYRLSHKTIVNLNKIFGVLFLGFIAYFTWNYYTNVKPKRELQQQEIPKKPTEPTPTVDAPLENKTTAMLYTNNTSRAKNNTMGLGMFSPNIFENKALYFYGNLNLEKSLMEHSPTDSITFKQREYGGFDIATAPHWLVPDHLKLDYDMLYFNVISVTEEFFEVIVNTTSNQTAFVSKRSGTLHYWPEFLLGINSVEFLNPETQKVYVKPLDHAGMVNQSYSFMRPLKVKQDWMYVLLLNDGFDVVGKGWIKWQDNNTLLISYNLLS